MNTKFGLAETQYHNIQPKVYCEEYIDEGTEELLPSDFKFMCVDGEIKSILIVTERTEKSYKLITYDTEWKRLDYVTTSYKTKNEFPKPLNLDLMIEISKKVSNLFDFVRVDFFEAQGKLYLGELTFTPQGGILSYFTDSAIKEMGRK